MEPKVALVKGERSIDTVMRAVELSGGVEHLRDRPVLIKVNFISTKTWESGATTDPVVVEGLIRAVLDVNPDVVVAESDANMTNADKAAKATGILDICDRYGVRFVNLKREKDRVVLKPRQPLALSKVKLPRIVVDSHIVDAAKLKTHSTTVVTLGMKNLFGLLPNKWKFRYHQRGIDKVIVDINSVVSPSLVLIDGFVAMEGLGPINGRPKRMDLLIASRDVVAADIVGTRVMGFDPADVGHIRMALQIGLGSETYQVVGETLEGVRTKFAPP